jgi:hypothetical protein
LPEKFKRDNQEEEQSVTGENQENVTDGLVLSAGSDDDDDDDETV